MIKLNWLVLAVIVIFSCNKKSPDAWYQSFGEEISSEGATIAEDYFKSPEIPDSANIKLIGNITAVCQEKGCWLKLQTSEGNAMRVTFKDYGFFVPKDASGNKVIIDGLLKKKTTNVETLRHYARDEGKSEEEIANITQPRNEFTFVANGVLIEESDKH